MPPVVFRKGSRTSRTRWPASSPPRTTAASSRACAPTASCRHAGRLTIHLAREFGFCYGVDRAVDYAYQTRKRFPDRRVFLTGEIIHNPHVNDQLRAQGIRFLTDPGEDASTLGPDDVVILPAFGVAVEDLAALERAGLHARRHDMRVGAERLEERPPLCAGRIHVGHSRQGAPRRDARDGVAGHRDPRRALPGGARRSRGPRGLRLHPHAATTLPPCWRDSPAPFLPVSIRAAIWSASAAPIRRRC